MARKKKESKERVRVPQSPLKDYPNDLKTFH
jgi:hypothetical protein